MRNPAQTLIATFIVSLLIIGSLNLIPFTQAADLTPETVPAPQISDFHNFNKSESYNGQAQANYDNEEWGLTIAHGDMKTRITARNYSNSNGVFVDYGMNFNFYMGGKFYIAMFTIDQVVILIGNDTLIMPLKNCDGFELTYSPVVYDGTIPTMDCNITFKNIRAHPESPGSAFDLTLINHFRGDWNLTSIKVEALLDFTDTDLGHYAAGEPFTAEIHYIMQLTDPGMTGSPPDYNTIKPSRYTDTTLEYNMTQDNGSPYTLSKLDMQDSFTIYNESGAYSAMGYSRMDSPTSTPGSMMQYNQNSRVVTHGFPNLIYKDTLSMKSDPEIIVYHDRVTDQSNPETFWLPIGAVVAITAISAIGVVVFLKKRKKKI
jgi:hypothetical protein